MSQQYYILLRLSRRTEKDGIHSPGPSPTFLTPFGNEFDVPRVWFLTTVSLCRGFCFRIIERRSDHDLGRRHGQSAYKGLYPRVLFHEKRRTSGLYECTFSNGPRQRIMETRQGQNGPCFVLILKNKRCKCTSATAYQWLASPRHCLRAKPPKT